MFCGTSNAAVVSLLTTLVAAQYNLGGNIMAVNCRSVEEQCKCGLTPPSGPPSLACPRTCSSCANAMRQRAHELPRLADVKKARTALMADTTAMRKARGIIETDCIVVARACVCAPSGASGRGSSVCVSGCKVCVGKHGYHYNVHELHAPAPTLDADNVAHVHLEDAAAAIRAAQAAAMRAECKEAKVFSVWTACKDDARCTRFRFKDMTLCRNRQGPVHHDAVQVRVMQQMKCPAKLCDAT